MPLGANRPWALAVLLPVLSLIAIWVLWREARVGQSSLLGFLTRWPGLVLLGFVLLLSMQVAPLGDPSISVSRGRTLNYLLVAGACAIAAWLVHSEVRSRNDLRLVLLTLVISGGLQSFIAILIMAGGVSFTMVDTSLGGEAIATGTFPNRNHLAAYLNLCLAAGAGLLLGEMKVSGAARSWRRRMRDWLNLILSAKARIRIVMVLMVIALILTRSRMGNTSFFIGLTVAVMIFGILVRANRGTLLLFFASVLVIDIVLIGAWVGFDRVIERIEGTALIRESAETPAPREESVEARVDPALEGISIVQAHPWFGTGGGTFLLSFLAHVKDDKGSFYDHAHNDYVEIAADTGLLGLGLLACYLIGSLWVSLRILIRRRDPVVRASAVALIMGTVCMLAHATVEFALQIPAYAISFTVLAILPWAARDLPSSRRRGSSTQNRAAVLMTALAGTMAIGFVANHALREGMASSIARNAIALLPDPDAGSQGLNPAVFDEAIARLQEAKAWSPTHPSIDDMMGTLKFSQAQLPDLPVDRRTSTLESAAQSYREAISEARSSPVSWGNLLLVKQELGQFDDEFRVALRQAAALGPYQPSVQIIVLSAVLAAWPKLSPPDQRLASDTLERGWATIARTLTTEARAAAHREQWCAPSVTVGSEPMRRLCSALAR